MSFFIHFGIICTLIAMQDLILTIEDMGDRSVGIWPQSITINFGEWELDEEDRKKVKDGAVEYFKTCVSDMPVRYAYFNDECADCGAGKLADGNCSNAKCVNNLHFGDDG